MNRPINKIISILLTTAMLNLCWMTSFCWAEIAAIDSAVAVSIQNSADLEKIRALLNREDVQHQLEAYGISHEEALARVNSLNDAEIAALVKDIDSVPAGGYFEGMFYAAMGAISLAIYLLAVLFRGIECIFSDCEAKGGLSYVFGPLRIDKTVNPLNTKKEKMIATREWSPAFDAMQVRRCAGGEGLKKY